ncbi:hypothetical protein NT01EI_2174 [Edwardsiella ictaluri 93-146]|uniref:Uncharacterized protein n=1 Tax=Edwardsiella ictaluri (strain 93-146) TaxID=634503 RepID=C5BFS2_EDWI9|nr:hypothetical protein NT01EI_2174 [Edwardsiella ictaluri 93-146]
MIDERKSKRCAKLGMGYFCDMNHMYPGDVPHCCRPGHTLFSPG